MNAIFEQWQQAGQLCGETSIALALRLLRGTEQFSEYQFASIHKGLQAGATEAQALLSASDRQHDKRSAPFSSQPFEMQLAYLQGLQQLAAELQRDVTAIVETQQKALGLHTTQAMQQVRTKAPAGAELMAATVQSMFDATSQAFQQATRMGRQIGALAESTKAAGSAAKQSAKNNGMRATA